MKLSTRSKSYMIPEYNLTGDLLSFLTCNLQYRYQNKGTLPPSMPVQLWFGEFIHGVMEEAFLKWKLEKTPFPWDWKTDIRPIEDMIDLRLQVRGLYPPEKHFFTINHPDIDMEIADLDERDHKKLASARAEKAINTWGPHLFPLIDSAEILIKGIREMPNYDKNTSRSNYYGINGVIDVLSSIKINKTEEPNTSDNYNNKILEFLKKDPELQKIIEVNKNDEFEIIIDYKGMKRPPKNYEKSNNKSWLQHEWQLQTYSWLRSKQEGSKPIIAGVIFYLNELVPSKEDLFAIQQDIHNNITDIPRNKNEYKSDIKLIENWDEDLKMPVLSEKFKIDRSFRIIHINETEREKALKEFDNVVENIEKSLIKEIKGCNIQYAWKANADERTCNACDFKTFCKKEKEKQKDFKIP